MKKSFDLSKLIIERVGEFKDNWTMARRPVTGEVLVFNVKDKNYRTDNDWIFYVQVPDEECGDHNIIIRPEMPPSRDELTGIERRAITVMPIDQPDNKAALYCKVNLSDPTGARNKIGVRYEERHNLPAWMKPFSRRMRTKESVRSTRGTDSKALVVLFKDGDYDGMVRLFIASRAWPLLARFIKQ